MATGMAIVFRAGWIPTPPERPRVRMHAALRAEAAPAAVNFYGMPTIGMHLNDTWGDCTVATDANIVQQQTFYGQGAEVTVSDDEVLKGYEASGFDPNAGQPGQNPTDQGWQVPDALGYLKNTGMAGHKIAAYGEVPVADTGKMRVAVAEFGCLSVGVMLPNIAVHQFDQGQPWDVVADDGGTDGGHCVLVAGYDADYLYVYTWSKVHKATWAWWAKYGMEAWAPISADWISATTGKDPEGVDKTVLGSEFEVVTGQNPFPAPSPAPPSPAPPQPTPAPVNPPPAPSPSPGGWCSFGRRSRSWRRLRRALAG